MNESLCESSAPLREVVSGRGSRLLFCRLAQSDDRFPKDPASPWCGTAAKSPARIRQKNQPGVERKLPSLGSGRQDLFHLWGREGPGGLRPDVALRPQVQEGGGGRRLVGGLADDYAVEGAQRPVLPGYLDAQLLGRGLRGPPPARRCPGRP